MDNANKILQLLFYIIWIPLGILLFGIVVAIVVTNSVERFNQVTNQPGGQSQSEVNQQQFQEREQLGGQIPDERRSLQQPNNLGPKPTGIQK